jgi:hypothetical protein
VIRELNVDLFISPNRNKKKEAIEMKGKNDPLPFSDVIVLKDKPVLVYTESELVV